MPGAVGAQPRTLCLARRHGYCRSGHKIVEQLAETGLVKDVADLYRLKAEAAGLEGYTDKKADNLIDGIQASKQQPLTRLIIGLGIRGVGEVAAEDLAEKFNDLDELSQGVFYPIATDGRLWT